MKMPNATFLVVGESHARLLRRCEAPLHALQGGGVLVQDGSEISKLWSVPPRLVALEMANLRRGGRAACWKRIQEPDVHQRRRGVVAEWAEPVSERRRIACPRDEVREHEVLDRVEHFAIGHIREVASSTFRELLPLSFR